MNKAVSIDLNTNVEVGQEDIIVPGDKITFKRKNVEQYLGLLSNMTAIKGDGWMTTTNKKITLVSDVDGVATLDIDGKEFKIDSNIKLKDHITYEAKIAGNVTSVAADLNAVYYIIRDKLNNVYLLRHPYDDSGDDEIKILSSTDEKDGNVFFLKGSTNYVVTEKDGANFNYSIFSKTSILQKSGTISNVARSPNNGALVNGNEIVGRDENDQYYCYAFNSANSALYKYIGHIDIKGNITGEPFPCLGATSSSITYATPTRLPNGVLRWTRLNNADSDLLNATSNLNYSQWDFKTISDVQANPPNAQWTVALSETGLNVWIMGVFNGEVAYIARSWPRGNHHITTLHSLWLTIDPSMTPGQFWSGTPTQYDNVFPAKYLYTNIQSNRGRAFIYGDGFIRCYAINAGLAQWSDGATWNIFDCITTDCYLYENNNGTTKIRYLEANKNGDVATYMFGSIPIPTIDNNGTNSVIIDSTSFAGNVRRHPLSSDQADNKAWNEWLYQIGGANYGDQSFVSDIPWAVKYGTMSLLNYNGYLIGWSVNKCLINTPNNEIEVWNVIDDNDGNMLIVDKENVYILTQNECPFKIGKIADYLFGTNCVTEYNSLQEYRGGVINLIRAFIPYNMSFEINDNWKGFQFKCPEDGSAANDTWLMGAGVNANLKDDYLAASFLLPAISIPIYVNSVDMTQFNKTILTGNQPLFKPVYQELLFDDEELLHYYTHSQASTDIIYRETIKGVDSYFNPDYEDNSWWMTSQTIYFPIGIARKVSGINYMSSTIDLNDKYTARLYVSNNQAYLIYNIAEQVYYGGTIFTIYTNSYYYDGEAIYSIISAGQTEFVCYAIGLKFLGNSGTEAYFYSPYDKSIYLFSGSNTLSYARSLSAMGNIIDSMFSSVNQRMFILDDNSKVLWLSNTSSGLYELEGINHLESSEQGAIMVGDRNYTIFSPRNDFDDVVPISLETGWIGDSTALNRFAYADIQLYSTIPTKSDVLIKILTKDGTDIKTTSKLIEIKPSMWKGNYLKVRATPDETVGQAFKIIIESADRISIMNIQVAFEEISSQPAPAAINI